MLCVFAERKILTDETNMKLKKNIAISESGFVFDPHSGESFSVNPIGAEIIELIKREKEFNEISDFSFRV